MSQSETKTCKICEQVKVLTDFYKVTHRYKNKEYQNYQSYCKPCAIAKYAKAAKVNPDKTKKQQQAWRTENFEKAKASAKKWQEEHKEELRVYRKEYYKLRLKNDINFRLKIALRARFKTALKLDYKAGSAVRDLGCTIPEFKSYLESKFTEGMTWDNYGQWHIDHIIPLSAFDITNRNELLIACNYLNLTPLWAKQNASKSDKLPPQEEIDSLVKVIGIKLGLIG